MERLPQKKDGLETKRGHATNAVGADLGKSSRKYFSHRRIENAISRVARALQLDGDMFQSSALQRSTLSHVLVAAQYWQMVVRLGVEKNSKLALQLWENLICTSSHQAIDRLAQPGTYAKIAGRCDNG